MHRFTLFIIYGERFTDFDSVKTTKPVWYRLSPFVKLCL